MHFGRALNQHGHSAIAWPGAQDKACVRRSLTSRRNGLRRLLQKLRSCALRHTNAR